MATHYVSVFLLVAALLSGCQRQTYRSDLYFKAGGKMFAFTVTVIDEKLYISVMCDAKEVAGASGSTVPGGKLARVETADLNADGNPELYAFLPKGSRWPGVVAYSCDAKECRRMGIEGAAGEVPPKDYCGEDAYSFEKDALVRQYTSCESPSTQKKLGIIRYKIKNGSSGMLLSATNVLI